ncbi:hypothetical protein ACSBR2_029433 [Camellia fascicularis]
MEGHPRRAEAERLLGIAEKLLQGQDFNGSRDFAILAQETEPLLEGPDQILAVAEVLLAAQKRINNHHDWYSILQVDRRSDDLESIKRQYRRLALLLHPDKNKFALADAAFRFVAAAWAVLSDSTKKSMYDNDLGLFSKVDLVASKNQRPHHHQFHQFRREQEDQPPPPPQQQQPQEFPVRRAAETAAAAGSSGGKKGGGSGEANFWTACPYCYNLYEYPKSLVDCCLRCQNCDRAFHAASIPSLPPLVPGKEAYYCCWGFFPLGFTVGNVEVGNVKKKFASVPKPTPPPPQPRPQPPPQPRPQPQPPAQPQPQPQPQMFPTSAVAGPSGGGGGFGDVSNATPIGAVGSPPKKRGRGRPRKNPLP